MSPKPIGADPASSSYDIVIVGGAIMGSSVAWFLSGNPDFDGSVLVVERDPSYANSSTARTNSCMRQQFSNEVNIRMSQFGADFVRNFRSRLGGDPEIPELPVHHFGYLYLADSEAFAEVLRRNQRLQSSLGAGTQILTPDEIAARWPFYNLDGIVCGSHNPVDEGYFDGNSMFDWWRRMARRNGVEYITNEVTAIARTPSAVTHVTLRSGATIACGAVVNASGPRAVETARMAGLELPVEPRRRFTFVFDAQEPLDRDVPLTIDPSGVHMRSDGQYYMTGCPPDIDPVVAYDDFSMDDSVWEDKVWPALVNRVPAFERIKVISKWAGHYAFNTLDQNAIIGPHPEVRNFYFINGFSGHGLQQSPAAGRGVAELITYGEFRQLDLGPLGYERIASGRPLIETAII